MKKSDGKRKSVNVPRGRGLRYELRCELGTGRDIVRAMSDMVGILRGLDLSPAEVTECTLDGRTVRMRVWFGSEFPESDLIAPHPRARDVMLLMAGAALARGGTVTLTERVGRGAAVSVDTAITDGARSLGKVLCMKGIGDSVHALCEEPRPKEVWLEHCQSLHGPLEAVEHDGDLLRLHIAGSELAYCRGSSQARKLEGCLGPVAAGTLVRVLCIHVDGLPRMYVYIEDDECSRKKDLHLRLRPFPDSVGMERFRPRR